MVRAEELEKAREEGERRVALQRELDEVVERLARTRRSGQVATWLMGLIVFFDDYANTLIVGSAMRPVTDRLRISREKLSYIVDSTAAPVAALIREIRARGHQAVGLFAPSLKAPAAAKWLTENIPAMAPSAIRARVRAHCG